MDIQETPIRQPPLSQQIEQILSERIRAGKYAPDSQLPAEDSLATEFKVSRATIRTALNTLSTKGLLVRRHGAGTFVTHFPRILNPLDQAIDFQELIARFCCTPSVEYGYCALEPAEEEIADRLRLEHGENVLVSQKVFLADKEPMIYCINTLPARLFSPDRLDQFIQQPDLLEPFFDFLEREVSLRVEYYSAQVRPVRAGNCRFTPALPLHVDTPILMIDEVAYTADNLPIFHTFEYIPENKMDFDVIRRRFP
jgi:GntR family transcriptional regulator